MEFLVNDSPLAGQEGKVHHLPAIMRERLFRELNTDVSLRVEETDSTGLLQGIWPWRAASVRPDREYAPRGL